MIMADMVSTNREDLECRETLVFSVRSSARSGRPRRPATMFTRTGRAHNAANAFCLVFAIGVSLVFFLVPFNPVHRGFFCDDVTIRYPYKEETVPVSLLIITAFLPALVLVLVMETTYGFIAGRRQLDMGTGDGGTKAGRFGGLGCGLGRGLLLAAGLMYGNLLCFSVTETFKLSFGRLRPSFVSACQPEGGLDRLSANCTLGYVDHVTCLNPDESKMRDMRKSFVSGHASFAAFNMLFIMLYLQHRLPLSTPRLLVSLLQSVAFGYAVFVTATRVTDHYHHPQDVLGGAALGVLFAVATVVKICPRFILEHPRTEVDLPTVGSVKQPKELISVVTKD